MWETIKELLQIITPVVALVGLPAVLFQLRHRRSANFTAALKLLQDNLQNTEVRFGRAVCRVLNKNRTTHIPLANFPDIKKWRSILELLDNNFGHENWFKKLLKCNNAELCRQMEALILKAYEAFDLAAILAWHANIPGLWYTLVNEWEDGIINTWEVGAPFLKKREKSSRRDLLECFSTLYIAAKINQENSRGLYPYRGFIKTFFNFQWKWRIAIKARKLRNAILYGNSKSKKLKK